MENESHSETHEYSVKGSSLVDKVKEIVREGRTRRIIIKKKDKVLLDIPMTAGVGGTAAAIWLLPQLTAIGLAASLLSDIRIVVEKDPQRKRTNTPAVERDK
jgi:hypothetical protein